MTPSNRDSISGWLDVLTSMLSLPESQREQVRDELEDHLRSRVDDLLITGTPEPEAIRTAVAELGETAELAKLITHAHTRSNPTRRRIMNGALIMTAIAGLSIGGLSLNNSGTVPAQTTQNETALASDQEKAVELSIGEVSMLDAVREIAVAFDREFVISPDSRELVHASFHYQILSGFTGSYTLDDALSKLESVSVGDLIEHKMVVGDDTVTLMTVDEYQRSLVVTQVHAAPGWLRTESDIEGYAESLYSLLSVKHDMGYSSIEVIGDAIVVAAPPNIQVEVLKMMHELDAVVQQRESEQQEAIAQDKVYREEFLERQRREQKIRHEGRQAEIARTIAQIQGELDRARNELLACKWRVRHLEQEFNTLDHTNAEAGSLVKAHNEIQASMDEARLELDESEERYTYLRARLLDTQYAHFFAELE